MSKRRAFRLGETIKEEVARIIREDLKDPRIGGFVTVTGVEVSEDLRTSKIYVSILGSAEEVKSSMEALNNATGYIRSEIGKIVHIRHVPEIAFKYDKSIEHGAHISKLLKDMGSKGDSADGEQ